MSDRPVVVWFRNDLRVHDHEPLHQAVQAGRTVVPLVCFDPRQFGTTSFGFAKTGPFRARFLVEAVADLRNALRARGSELIVRHGKPEEVVPGLADAVGADEVLFHAEVTDEETRVEHAMREALDRRGIALREFWGATLFHRDDLPFEVGRVPEVFTQFRRRVEDRSTVRPPMDAPATLPPLPAATTAVAASVLDPGAVPTPEALGVEPVEPDPRGALAFEGGETAGLARLHDYLFERDLLRNYKNTRNGMLGADYSSKFSPWLAAGCLSPRRIHAEVQRYEVERVRNKSTYWLVFELIWRDYFRFICAKHGTRVFLRGGLQGLDLPWSDDRSAFDAWREGRTGYPLVDANMRELAATGFMSNRGRQIVASFLTKNLGIDWRMGAEWFESRLVDYDPCSNWGNWNYAAGVGNDARGFRYFSIERQAETYDRKGAYVRHWLPELAHVPADAIHRPWTMTAEQQRFVGLDPGRTYPPPIVDFDDSIRRNEDAYRKGVKSAFSH